MTSRVRKNASCVWILLIFVLVFVPRFLCELKIEYNYLFIDCRYHENIQSLRLHPMANDRFTGDCWAVKGLLLCMLSRLRLYNKYLFITGCMYPRLHRSVFTVMLLASSTKSINSIK